MANFKGVQIEGLKELEDMFDTMLPREAQNLNRATIHGLAGEVSKQAKDKVPIDTGNLKKAIKSKRRRARDPDRPVSDVVVVTGKNQKNDGYYWRFVEYGTKDLPERPFFKPAIQWLRQNYVAVYKEQFFKKLASKIKRDREKAK